MASKQQGNASSSGKQGKSASPRPSTTNSAGDMSVREAGHKGGQRVRELVGEGRQNDRRH